MFQKPRHFAIEGAFKLSLAVGVSTRRPWESDSPHLFALGLARTVTSLRPVLPSGSGPPIEASGVGNDPDALPDVRGAEVRSSHHERPRGVSRLDQHVVNPVIASSSEARDVLSESPTGSQLPHDPHVFPEQSGALAVDALAAVVRFAGVLAGRAPGHNVNWSDSVSSESVGSESTHVVIDLYPWEVGRVGAPAIGLDLAGSQRAEARPVQPEGPATSGA